MVSSLYLLLPLVSSVYAATFTVGVGKDETTGKTGLGFDPSAIYPVAGDEIVFVFQAGTHSVIQTSFDNPCTPLAGGFNSGPQTVPDGTAVDAPNLPTKSFKVTDTQPIWFYDGGDGLCKKGAVFSANAPPTGSQTMAKFIENAKNSNPAPAPPTSSGSGSSSPSGSTSNAPPATTSTSAAAPLALNNAIPLMLGFLGATASIIF
jgi:plastocyanin